MFQGAGATEWRDFDAIRQLRKGRKAGIGTGDLDIKRGEKYLKRQVAAPPSLQASVLLLYKFSVISYIVCCVIQVKGPKFGVILVI